MDYIGGCVQNMGIWANVQSCNYGDIAGGWVQKNPKMCLRNIYVWMVPTVLLEVFLGMENL